MPPDQHAVLSASSAHRWLHCTPAPRLEQAFNDTESAAAAEGTAAHALAAYKLMRKLKLRCERPVSVFENEEMDRVTDDYVDFVNSRVIRERRRDAEAQVFVERKVDFSNYVKDGFGTADCLIVSKGRVACIDYKHGMGLVIDAYENPQLMLYALGVLNEFGEKYGIKKITLIIFQPRRENVSIWETTACKLTRWANKELKPKAELAYNGEGEYCAGDWCLFCKAAVKCRARAQDKLKLAQSEFKLPPLLTDAEIESVLAQLPDLKKWADELQDYALKAALGGKQWTGFKLVEGRSVRKYVDESKVVEAAESAGYHDIYKKSLISLTEMERLMGKKDFEKILGGLIVKPQGKPTLVPETDKRAAINVSAKNDFNVYQGEIKKNVKF